MAVAVIGAGSIGNAFSLLFSKSGSEVNLFEEKKGQRDVAQARIADIACDLHEFGLLNQSVDELLSRIPIHDDIEIAVSGVDYVQECIPEDLALKCDLFSYLDQITPNDVVLASSSSAITASEFAGSLPGASRCLVAHPANPPFLLRVVEVVPSSFTSSATVEKTKRFMNTVGLVPIVLKKELKGFVFNRLQGTVLREAHRLVRDGVCSVEDIDTLVRDGLGLRWSVVGPFETADLNRRGGIGVHARIMGPAYSAMGEERGEKNPWTPELSARVEKERRALLPLENWEERVRWRDRQLMKIISTLSDDSEGS